MKTILAATPVKAATKLGDAAATAALSATRGAGQTSAPVSALSVDHRAQIDAAMGIKSKPVAPSFANGVQTFPAMTRAEGVAYLEQRAKDAAATK